MSLRRTGLTIVALAAGAGMLVLLAHAPFARRAVLGYAGSVLQRDYGLVLDSARIDYNLAGLRVGLADVRLSAEGSVNEPFFESDYVAVRLSPGVLLGNLAIRDLSLTNARVRVHRRADGTSNLPSSDGSSGGDPAPLSIARFDVSRLAIDILDEPTDMRLQVPAMAVLLMRERGSISLTQPAEIRAGRQMTTISALNAEATFDGRTLRLANGQVRSAEAAIGLDGSLLLIAREPSIDLRVRGTGDIARLARWGIPEGGVPEGTLAFDGQIAGPLTDPRAQLNATSARVAMDELAVIDVRARALVSSAALEVESLEFGVASGLVKATASIPFAADAMRRVGASWNGVDTTAATRLFAPDLEYLPVGLSSGELSASGTGTDVPDWQGSVRLQIAGSRNSRGRLAAPGETRVTLDNAQWQLAARHALAGVAPVELDARGGLRDGQLLSEASMDAGAVRLGETELSALVTALRDVGIASVDPGVVTAGRLEATFGLTGRLVDPEARGTALITSAAGEGFDVTSARAEISGHPFRPNLAYSIEAPEAVVSGQRVRDLRATGRLTDAAGPIRGTRPTTDPAAADTSGPLGGTRPANDAGLVFVMDTMSASQADGSGRLSGSASYELSTGQYSASIEGMDWQLMPTEELPATGLMNLRFAGMGTPDAPRGAGEMTVRDAAWQGTRLGELSASVTLDGGPAAQIEAHAPEFGAAATARVQIAAPYEAVVDARADRLDLARMLRDVATPTPIGGVATGSVHFEGSLEAWRAGTALVEVAALDATAGDLPIRFTEPARVRYEGERIYIDRFEASAGETAVSASGDLAAFDPAPETQGVLVVLTGGVGEVARAVAATGLTELPLTGGTGPVALLARVTGSVQVPVLAADLEMGPGTISLLDLPEVSGVLVRAHAGDGWIELREGAASYQEANIAATGRAPLSWLAPTAGPVVGGAELHARVTNVTAAVLSPFLDPSAIEEITGSLDATLDAESPTLELAALTGQLEIDRLEVRVADLPVAQRVPTRIVARDGFARVEAWDWVGQGATLAVQGQVRLEDRQAAFLANGVVDLRMLTPFVRDAGMATAGRLEPRLSITGALDNPRIDGDLTMTGGEIRLADPRVLVSELDARAVLTQTSAQITSLTGSVNGGTLTGGGALDYTPEGGLGAQLSTTVRGMALEFPEGLRSEVDADLNLAATALVGASEDNPTSGLLSGTVTVLRGSYREPLAVVAGLLAGLRTQGLTAGTESSPFLSALALDVRLVTDEDVIVDNNYGRLDLGADLRVIGTAAAPVLSGRADLREGGQLFVGRNTYTISSGAIDFSNPVVIEPNLNVVATTRAGGEDIEVRITGPAESPSVDLSSGSGLGQAEVASLLLTGRRLEDLAPGDAAFVGTQVLGNFSAEVLGFASQAVGLDTIRLGGIDTPTTRRDPFAAATEIDPTTRLTFGKSIGPDVNVTFSQSLRESDAQAWIVDYALRRGLELRLVSDDENLRSYGFRHDLSFGGMNRAIRAAASREVSVPRVTAVNLSGDLVVPEARVREALRLAPGDGFDFGEWQDDRERVERLYRDQGYLTPRISARRAVKEGEVVLTYDIATGPQTRIVAVGIDLDAGLRSELENAWVESVFDEFLIGEASDIIRADLARRGYLRPDVNVRIRDEANTKTLDIVVEPGLRSTRTVVRIEGATETLARQIEMHLDERGLVEGVVLDSRAVEREGSTYLRSNGYLRARVSAGTPLFEGDTAVLPLRIDSGPVYTVAGVTFEGARGLSDEMLREAVELTEEVPYDPGLLEGARNRLVALHRREGFAAATVTVRPSVREDAPAVDVVFVVTEGARETLGEVVVVGNRGIDTDVVLRAIDLSVGEPLRTEELLRARTRLFETGLFRRIDIASEPVESSPGGSDVVPMRLRVTVEEWPALRLRYGVLVAEEFRPDEIDRRELVPGVSADVSRRTLFGRAVTVGAVMGLQRREQRGRVFLSTPTLAGLSVESSFIAERSHEEFEGVTLVTNRSTFSWEQRTRPARNLDLSYSYTFEQNRTFDTKPPDPFVPALDIRINLARLNAAAAWDTRDDPSDTARGLLASSSVEYAPEALGSDIRFIRQVAQAYYFRPWRGLVFASAARLGTVTALGGQELIPSERFLAGGSRTVRSVAENSLGPRDFFGSPAGGEMMIVFNQEARLPIYRWVRGVAFVDAGNVFAERRGARLGDLVGALGFGLRLSTPIALLRLDYAKTAWGAPTSSGLWTFGIGHAF